MAPALVLLLIALVTVAFGISNRPETYPPPPAGWTHARPPHIVLALAEQGDTIWAGGPDGLVALDRYSLESVTPTAGGIAALRFVRGLCVDHEDALWIAHLAGVTRWKDGTATVFTRDDGLPAGYAAAVIQDRKGVVWVGTESGVATYDGLGWHAIEGDAWSGAVPVTVIFEDRDGVLWFGSDSANSVGVTRYDGALMSVFSTNEGLVHNTVTDIIQTDDGAIWVATGLGNRGGATRIAAAGVTSLTRADGLAGDRARALFEDSYSRLWVTSEWDGVAVLHGGAWKYVTPYDGLAGWEVMDIMEDTDGVLWLGTDNGITRIQSVGEVFPAS
jgi:ligand-binding sensor domain-containing protein